ncbi:unnamed protein product [Didymodactylos carnosus]|uniref:G-protein coupled receptors family 1 profile domain-containing protein n=1 Tax=Didymodactylos carnosus TaxID=1234261 RepID=A0A8S2EIY1_9BILA|nr:unnamed protein product [Didymodactylos carnosus]CAF3997379.1 unnamed protein product [Didymodactylos carnosus]
MIRSSQHQQASTKTAAENKNDAINEKSSAFFTYLIRRLICMPRQRTRCFFDERYMCLCTNEAYFDCFRFNHSESNCTHLGYCLNGGYRLESMDKNQFACVCPKCYYGNLCQFTTSDFSICIDALFDNNIGSNEKLLKQSYSILLVIIIIIVLGFISNILSVITFCQPGTREVGCGLYLLALSIVSLLGLLLFAFRICFLLMMQMSYVSNVILPKISCISLEYLLTILPSMYDWLTAAVAIERTMIALTGLNFEKKKSVTLAKYVICGIILMSILLSLHEPFNRSLIGDPQFQGRYWCVSQYKHKWLETYVKATKIFNLIVPFLINFVTIILILITIVRHKLACQNESRFEILKQQLSVYKVFILSPFIIILFESPRLILTFSLACIQSEWQKYLYLSSYFISVLPLILTFVICVITKESYRKELIKFKTNLKIN